MIGFLGNRRHARIRHLLSAYVDGQVTESELAHVERHLGQCPECRLELESLRTTVGLLKRLPQLEAPRSFALSQEPVDVRWTPPTAWAVRLAASVAGLLLVALLVSDLAGLVDQRRVLEEAAAPSTPAVTTAAPAPAALAAPVAATEKEVSTAERPIEALAAPAEEAPPAEGDPVVVEALPPPEAASGGGEVTGEEGPQQTRREDGGVQLPLWQLEVALGGLVAALMLISLRTWRRRGPLGR